MGRRVVTLGLAALLAFVSVASAQPAAGEAGTIAVTSTGARLGDCETLEFPSANYSPSRTGNVCSLPASASMTALGSVIGDAAGEIYQSTSLPATCDVGMTFFETDQPVPSTSADVCWMYVCTATNTWTCLGDVLSGGRTGGQTIRGGAAADETLRLQGTANSDPGKVMLNPSSFTTGEIENLVGFDTAITMDNSAVHTVNGWDDQTAVTGAFATTSAYNAIRLRPTYTCSSGLCAGGVLYGIYMDSTYNVTGATGIPSATLMQAIPTTNITNVAATAATQTAINYSPTFNVTGASGAWTATTDTGLLYAPTITTNTAGGAMTMTDSAAVTVNNGTSSGAAGTRTWTRQNGIWIKALTSGTSNFPIRLTEAAASSIGTVPSGAAIITATSGSPDRITIANENQQLWDVGYTSWFGSTGLGTSLSTSVANFFPINGFLAPVAAASEANVQMVAPGALHVFAMACAVSAAPANGAGTQTYTFTMREAGADTGAPVSCVISEAATTCTWCYATSGTPCGTTNTTATEAVAAGATIDIGATPASTPTASKAGCTIWYTLDAF